MHNYQVSLDFLLLLAFVNFQVADLGAGGVTVHIFFRGCDENIHLTQEHLRASYKPDSYGHTPVALRSPSTLWTKKKPVREAYTDGLGRSCRAVKCISVRLKAPGTKPDCISSLNFTSSSDYYQTR